MSSFDDVVPNSIRDTERLLDNFISEGQMILSRAYEIRLKARSEKAFGEISGDIVSEGIKHFIGIPKKYSKPFMKRKSVNEIVDEALVGSYDDWLSRLRGFLETVSEYYPKLRKSNSRKLVIRLAAIDARYVHIDTRVNHVISFLNSLRNKSTIFNNIIPEIVKAS